MSFCIHCGQHMLDDARFCQGCGKSVSQDENYQQYEEISQSPIGISNVSTTSNSNRLVIEIAVGLGILFLMYLLGEIVGYPSKYHRMSLIENVGSFLCYGLLFGFATRAMPIINKSSKRYIIEQGLGGALVGIFITGILYFFMFIVEVNGNSTGGMYVALGLLLFILPLPFAKSVNISIGFDGFKFNGIEKLKRNLGLGVISSIVALVLGILMEAAHIDLSFYSILGIIGFINYLSLITYGNTTGYRNSTKESSM